jgi:3-oxoadipate enol-lactonase
MPPARGRLHTIAAPALVIVGGQDHPSTQARAGELVSSIDGAEKLVIAEAAHMVNVDAPATLTRAIQEFVSRSRT